MQTKEAIIAQIKRHLPGGTETNIDVDEQTLLSDLGVQSMHLISLVLTLQAENALDIDKMDKSGMPVTFGDLIRLVDSLPPHTYDDEPRPR